MAVPRPTPLHALARGLVAGLVGTAAMTAYQELVSKVRSSGSKGSGGASEEERGWEEAPTPARAGRRFLAGVFEREPTKEKIPLLTDVVHWGYGTAWGVVYGLVKESLAVRSLPAGLAFGAGVWATSYVLLPAMKLYKPPWEYSPKTLSADLSYHLVYGAGVSVAYRALDAI